MTEKRHLPAFKSEAEEARWWFENREARDEEVAQAIRNGRTGKNSLSSRAAISLPQSDAKPQNSGTEPPHASAESQTD